MSEETPNIESPTPGPIYDTEVNGETVSRTKEEIVQELREAKTRTKEESKTMGQKAPLRPATPPSQKKEYADHEKDHLSLIMQRLAARFVEDMIAKKLPNDSEDPELVRKVLKSLQNSK